MSNGSDRRAAGDELWVVDVTAPLASGRVREVAADAAARLKLPVEKLIALLENRIGPVTKPLPHASAARVAEVLHLSGAEVHLRPADSDDAPVPREGPDAAVPESVENERAEAGAAEQAAQEQRSADNADNTETEDPASPPEHTASQPDDVALETDAPAAAPPAESGDTSDDTSDGTPEDPTVGRASRGRSPAGGAPDDRGRDERRPDGDPWERLSDDASDDEAMLAGWKRAPEPTARPVEARPVEARPVADGAASPDEAPEGASSAPPATPPTARPGPSASAGAASPARSASRSTAGGSTADRVPIGQRPPARERPDEEPSSWSYGLRDPFAEAEARERTLRRWVLMIALLIASTIFVVLQWAYSRPNLDGRGPSDFEDGLVAYRDGAFVSAARAWTPLAEDGDPTAMYMLGWMAEFGQGRPWSNREAASWYRQAAERGHAPSQLRLADLYRRGLGVEYDLEVALGWYLAAAESGIPRAQREAALVLARLDRVDDARVWLARAASGDPDAAAWWKLVSDAGNATNVSP